MSDVGIALLVLAICVVAAIVIAILIRIFGIYHFTTCFASGEEKAVLTQHEQFNGYMVSSLVSVVDLFVFFGVRDQSTKYYI